MSGDVLSLTEALQRWCERSLVESVKAEERSHARRVIEGPDAKLIAPGKISLMH